MSVHERFRVNIMTIITTENMWFNNKLFSRGRHSTESEDLLLRSSATKMGFRELTCMVLENLDLMYDKRTIKISLLTIYH